MAEERIGRRRIPAAGAAMLLFATAQLAPAQTQSVTVVSTDPAGIDFTVDGTLFTGTASFLWPQGSKHILNALGDAGFHTRYAFQSWQWSGGQLPGNPVAITADPLIQSYKASFQVQYGLNVVFNTCDVGSPCASPGMVSVNGTNINSSQELYLAAQSTVTLQAFPNPGYVFTGWLSGLPQVVQGFQTKITLTGPTVVQPQFAPTQSVNLLTLPGGLSVLADHSLINTPNTLEWGVNTTHTLAASSPQRDSTGGLWVFSSWSDGGAPTHAYTVPSYGQTTVTANFIPGVAVAFPTSPAGLSLTIDGRSDWPAYTFTWGVGETHTLQAPATQTDSKGRVWSFANWSNGGSATQTFTVPSGNGSVVTANYTQMGHMSITSALAGLSVTVNGNACVVPCDIQQPIGTQITVTAPVSLPMSSGSRQDFVGWSNGAGTGTLSTTLGTDYVSVSANYHQMNYLATQAAPAGAASWNLQPGSADGFYDAATNVSVSVTPLPGYRFRAWSGDLSGPTPAGMLVMSSPRAVQAAFDKVPYVAPAGVSNGAGNTPQDGVAPGSVASIFGANLAATTVTGPSSPMVQTLGRTTVRMGDRLFPLFFVSPAQINFYLPADVTPGSQTLTVSTQGQPDVQAAMQVVQDAPGLFANSVDGQSFALAVHADGSPVTSDAPVRSGETITVYGTGFGASNPARPFGFAIPKTPVYALTDPITVQVGSAAAVAPVAAFALPGSVGVDAVQFTLGPDAPTGTNAQLTVTVNGQNSNTVLLPLQ